MLAGAAFVAALTYAVPRVVDAVRPDRPARGYVSTILSQRAPERECIYSAGEVLYHAPDGYHLWVTQEISRASAFRAFTWTGVSAGCEKKASRIIEVSHLPLRPRGGIFGDS